MTDDTLYRIRPFTPDIFKPVHEYYRWFSISDTEEKRYYETSWTDRKTKKRIIKRGSMTRTKLQCLIPHTPEEE